MNYLIGLKLYKANWLELQAEGYIAKMQCSEVLFPMIPALNRKYVASESTVNGTAKKNLHCVLNPEKFQACQFLIRHHERRNDKIIVFSDNVNALKHYDKALKKPLMCGEKKQKGQLKILKDFKEKPSVRSPVKYRTEGEQSALLKIVLNSDKEVKVKGSRPMKRGKNRASVF